MSEQCARESCPIISGQWDHWLNDHERQLCVERRLTSMESKVDAINEKLDNAILSQLRDHGKRLSSLEHAKAYSIGWVVGVAGATGVVGSLLGQLLKL